MLSRCSAYSATGSSERPHHAAATRVCVDLEGSASDDDHRFRLGRLLHRSVAGARPAPVLRPPARARIRCAVRSTTACWRSPAGKRPTPSTRTPRTTRRASRSPGPFTPMPFTPEGDDICAQLEEHRTEIPMYEHMVTMDPPHHTDARSASDPAADTQAAQGERGLHVAAGRSPHRRVHRRRQVRVPHRVRQAVLAAGRRRPARRPRGGPRGVPRGVRGPAAGNEHRRPRPRG